MGDNGHTLIYDDLQKYNDRIKGDISVKKIFANKQFLAWVLITCTEEFKGYSFEKALGCLENLEVSIGVAPVDQDTAGKSEHIADKRMQSDNTEDSSINEGTVYYDVKFTIPVPHTDDAVSIILNIEGQGKGTGLGYEIPTRMIYYLGRLISAEKNTVFTGDNYQDIIKTYSIWIVISPGVKQRNTVTEFYFVKKDIFGKSSYSRESYDKMTGIIINLEPGIGEKGNDILDLCNAMFSAETLEKKAEYLEKKFDIKFTKDNEGGVSGMEGFAEAYYSLGAEHTEEKAIVMSIKLLKKKGFSDSEIISAVQEEYHVDDELMQIYMAEAEKSLSAA